VKGKPES